MNLYINDFSFDASNTAAERGEEVLRDFIDVCERVSKCSFERIYMPSDFKSKEIVSGFSFGRYLGSSSKSDSLRIRLVSIIAHQLRKIDWDEQAEPLQYVYWNSKDSEFFRRAYNLKVPVISFRTQPTFDDSEFKVVNNILDGDEEILEVEGTIINLSNREHFKVHKDYLSKKQQEQAEMDGRWNPLARPIRFVARTTQFLNDNDFDIRKKNQNTNVRVSLANSLGSIVAEMNGWVYDGRLTRRNGRHVFKAMNQKIYLTIDTETVSFELHGRSGEHHGEYDFYGNWLEGAQSHRLIVN